jgi:hypothetical protein
VGTKASLATKHQVLEELDTVEETVDESEVALYYDALVSHPDAPLAFHADDYNNHIRPCDIAIVRAAAVTEVVTSSREGSVFKCALARIRARRLSCVLEAHRGPSTAASDHGNTDKISEPTQAMMASWENHKNNKRKRETAITCYHKMESTDAQGPAKRHKIMIDTGANVTLLRKDKEHCLTGAKDSKIKIEVANKRCMTGSLDGTAHMHILKIGQEAVNQSAKTATDTGIVLAYKVTTVQDLSRELFSIDDMFLNGCSILLRAPEYRGGGTLGTPFSEV